MPHIKIWAQRRMRRALAVRGRQECILMGIIINTHVIEHISLSASTPAPCPGNWIVMRISGHCIHIITTPPIHSHTQKETAKDKNLFSWLLTDHMSSWWMLCLCTPFHRLMACQPGTYQPHLLWAASLPTMIICISRTLPGTYLKYKQLTGWILHLKMPCQALNKHRSNR